MLAPWLAHAAEPTVSYEWFEYVGKDAVFEAPLTCGSYRNPILAGFYPDPSVTRVGDKFHLVNSTFVSCSVCRRNGKSGGEVARGFVGATVGPYARREH